MREFAGVLVKDWLRYETSLMHGNDRYLQLRNRLERISIGPGNKGYVCLWPYTSRLHAPKIIPYLGKRLLRICVRKSTFLMKEHRDNDLSIQVSVLIGHRGLERLPHLLATIKSFAAQSKIGLECIVIEQDRQSLIKEYLPCWIKHIFLKTETNSSSYNRSAGFNYGARYARGSIFILHDNDMLVPTTYCRDMVDIAEKGYNAINTKRFVFYLSRLHSERVMLSFNSISSEAPEYIIQNLEAGGSMAITREAYYSIGGMDEEFVGWGGEDIEFWQRCSILNRWIWGYQPIIHLWHQSQPLKVQADNPNIARIKSLEQVHLDNRVKFLKTRNWGRNSND